MSGAGAVPAEATAETPERIRPGRRLPPLAMCGPRHMSRVMASAVPRTPSEAQRPSLWAMPSERLLWHCLSEVLAESLRQALDREAAVVLVVRPAPLLTGGYASQADDRDAG